MNDGSVSTELVQFFGAYFHQDWDLEADDWQGIVDSYVIGNPGSESQRQIAKRSTTCARPSLKLFWRSS